MQSQPHRVRPSVLRSVWTTAFRERLPSWISTSAFADSIAFAYACNAMQRYAMRCNATQRWHQRCLRPTSSAAYSGFSWDWMAPVTAKAQQLSTGREGCAAMGPRGQPVCLLAHTKHTIAANVDGAAALRCRLHCALSRRRAARRWATANRPNRPQCRCDYNVAKYATLHSNHRSYCCTMRSPAVGTVLL
jgi:hypothetical protein